MSFYSSCDTEHICYKHKGLFGFRFFLKVYSMDRIIIAILMIRVLSPINKCPFVCWKLVKIVIVNSRWRHQRQGKLKCNPMQTKLEKCVHLFVMLIIRFDPRVCMAPCLLDQTNCCQEQKMSVHVNIFNSGPSVSILHRPHNRNIKAVKFYNTSHHDIMTYQ